MSMTLPYTKINFVIVQNNYDSDNNDSILLI